MAKSVGLSREDMDHPNLHEHINNQLFGDGTSTLSLPSAPQGGDATRVAPGVRHGGTSMGDVGAAVESVGNSVARAVVPAYAEIQDKHPKVGGVVGLVVPHSSGGAGGKW